MSANQSKLELNPFLWLWAPLLVLAVSIVAKLMDDEGPQSLYNRMIVGEYGIVENVTLILLATAVISGIRLLRDFSPAPQWLRYWLILLVLGSIFFLGEEASWGQHLIGWTAPETWQELNQQQETNLHNLTEFGVLFDQLPRNLLTAAAVIGGLLVPVYRRIRSLQWTPSQYQYWLWPTLVCAPSAVLAIVISMPKKIYRTLEMPPPDLVANMIPGEFKECFLAFFIMLYILSLSARIRQAREAA